jgi:hypothetical protein
MLEPLMQLDAFTVGSRSAPTGTIKMHLQAPSPDEYKAIAMFLANLNLEKESWISEP